MATHLTERIVKAAEIGTRKYVIFDEDCAGFGLCVFLSGRKGFPDLLRGWAAAPHDDRNMARLVGDRRP